MHFHQWVFPSSWLDINYCIWGDISLGLVWQPYARHLMRVIPCSSLWSIPLLISLHGQNADDHIFFIVSSRVPSYANHIEARSSSTVLNSLWHYGLAVNSQAEVTRRLFLDNVVSPSCLNPFHSTLILIGPGNDGDIFNTTAPWSTRAGFTCSVLTSMHHGRHKRKCIIKRLCISMREKATGLF